MWTLRVALEYVRFLLLAKRPAAMHSPYLYDLLPHAFDGKKDYYFFGEIASTRHRLSQSTIEITASDQGAGSRRKSKRTVGGFADMALSSPRQCEFLFRLVASLKPETSIELGAALGISTAHIAKAYSRGHVYAFDGNAQFIEMAREVMDEHHLQNVSFVEGEFDTTLAAHLESLPEVDFAFIDGNHRLEPAVNYFQLIRSHASDRCVIVLDDIRWSPGMLEAWNQVRQDSMVKVSIDAFSFGLLFLGDRFKDKQHYRMSPSILDGGPILG